MEEPQDETFKFCSRCKTAKHVSNFVKSSHYKDGYFWKCRDCKRDYDRERHKKVKGKKNQQSLLNYYNNKASYYARAAERRGYKSKSTPSWLTKHHHKEIRDFYWLAKDLKIVTGETYHVDHIVPLKGKNVCGLHVPWNLQVLPADINLSKGNKHANNA